jgi:N-acetylglucosaminyldiphosphoundecaprenol N-acetyl-beta-D-mannosaminyltransferase
VDLDVVIVSHRDERWLEACLNSLEQASGACTYRATIVENGGSQISLAETSNKRVLYRANRGFAAANNEGARGSVAEVLLFLNPDTELTHGTLEALVKAMRDRSDVGLVSVRQVTGDGSLWPSLPRFPTLRRAMAAAVASERWPRFGMRLGERVLDEDRYSQGGPFDWTTGAVFAVRREAFEAVAGFDERFFLFSEETDLCKRIQEMGWQAYHDPAITFVHHAGKAGVHPRREAQMAYGRLQYAKKHFSRVGAVAYHAILVMHHAVRLTLLRFRGSTRSSRAEASGLALKVLLGRCDPPYRCRETRIRRQRGPTEVIETRSETAPIMGLPFHRLDHGTLIDLFLEGVHTRTGGWIVTPNLDILRQFTASVESRRLILDASHRVADGLPIVWASRLAGIPVPERVPGSDLVLSMPAAAAGAGLSVFLLGGNPGVAAAAARQLEARYPGLPRVNYYCPPFGFENDPRELEGIRDSLRDARPALVLIGLGFPKQERLIRLLRAEMPETWFVGVGISLSFLAGEQPRAPAALQRIGLEWTHRLWHEPRRLFRRYVVQGFPFCLRLLAWALTYRLRATTK